MATPTPESETPELQHGLEVVAQFTYPTDTHLQYSSPQPNSQYGSPTPGLSPYYTGPGESAYPDPAQMVRRNFSGGAVFEVGERNHAIGSQNRGRVTASGPRGFAMAPSPYYAMPIPDDAVYANVFRQNSHQYTSTPGTTPSSPHNSLTTSRTTRSGRAIASDPLRPQPAGVQKASSSKPAGKAAPKPRKKKKANGKVSEPSVTRPLTELLAYLKGKVAETDIAAYVGRSIEVRRKEVADDKNHKIKRPMNAFMLYRKAWQNRIKAWQTNDNHQGVSKVAGDGWPLESDELRQQYTDWATQERDMHSKAFPDYKFMPAKTRKGRPKPPVYSEDGDDSELEDNWSGIPAGTQRAYSAFEDPNDPDYLPPGRAYTPHHHYQSVSRAMSQSPYQHSPPPPQHLHPHQLPQQQHMPNMSHYAYANPGKPLPRPYPGLEQGHYASQRVDVSQYSIPAPRGNAYTVGPPPLSHTENVYYHETSTPSSHHHYAPVPGQQQHNMSLPGSHYGSPANEPLYDLSPTPPPPQHHQQQRHMPVHQQQQQHYQMAPPPSYPQQQLLQQPSYSTQGFGPVDEPFDLSGNGGADNFDSALQALDGGYGDPSGGYDQFLTAEDTLVDGFNTHFEDNLLDPSLLEPDTTNTGGAGQPGVPGASDESWEVLDVAGDASVDSLLGTATTASAAENQTPEAA
ncbi:hypothetical protein JX265_006209 [Neoarthrinium moseri]|uniref:HMG box domain-containing protein n=1 Tax=Neoarthrinium moseri TaxID=1658444 RepID=A0A9P9WM76_9PEZI|nr:hypothetical protein JX265_006209 [Neoarthrinium moseri]